jgi:hypothetical protein
MSPVGPSAAGGTNSLWVAYDLTENIGATEGYRQIIDDLSINGYAIGGHIGDREVDESRIDCGAYDSLVDIYGYIANDHDRLRVLSADLGFIIDEKTSRSLALYASRRRDMPSSAELFEHMKSRANPALIDCLTGEHKEILVAVNTVKDTTIDRRALRSVFGHDYQAFNVDFWAFEDAAIAVSKNESEVAARHAAIIYYNLATVIALCGSSVKMVVV